MPDPGSELLSGLTFIPESEFLYFFKSFWIGEGVSGKSETNAAESGLFF